jgi:hypothetical protein
MHFVTAQQNAQGGALNDLSGEKLNFQLYPNPYTGGKLHIVSPSTDIKNIMILNILGEVVFQTTTYENYVMLQQPQQWNLHCKNQTGRPTGIESFGCALMKAKR